ncbi:MAG: hypothetical protein JJU11_16485, partial [Candidatus Sumerlaeia bacterium]|nr:hypothetical protein [Candidatus Sumerlaeia bacterium]
GGIYGRTSGYVFSGNLHADLCDPFPQANGLSSTPHAYVATSSDDFGPDDYIATFDTDLDGIPDFVELRSGGSAFNQFDSLQTGFPDGPASLDGFDPGSFSLTASTNPEGIVDWYRESLLAYGVDPAFQNTTWTLGDITRSGDVNLGDAVRSLQLINGTLPFSTEIGNLNAMRVTGGPATSLANSLQILRFQAGVRNGLPAVPGID